MSLSKTAVTIPAHVLDMMQRSFAEALSSKDASIDIAFCLNAVNPQMKYAVPAIHQILEDATGRPMVDLMAKGNEDKKVKVLFYIYFCGRPRMDLAYDRYQEAYNRADHVILVRMKPLDSRHKVEVMPVTGWEACLKKDSTRFCGEDLTGKVDLFCDFNWLYRYVGKTLDFRPLCGYEVNPNNDPTHNDSVRNLKAKMLEYEGGKKPVLPPRCEPNMESMLNALFKGHFTWNV